MFRFLGVGAILLAAASTGVAGEHYVEIWNPPEARLVKPPVNGKPKPGKASLLSHSTSKAEPRRVTDSIAKVSPNRRMGDHLKKPMTPRATDLPRIMTPEGNVLRVTARGASAEVVR
ncbi:hypothetical protein WN982_40900 [Paraburkholderia sp. IMGN_8]|uniref:hypothetical protein n=1 Tax=Paraburkholderia sp. IMGN_8 TaxID=3136564 RepID=UPI0031019E08